MGLFSVPLLNGSEKSDKALSLFTDAVNLLEDANLMLEKENAILKEQAEALLEQAKDGKEVQDKNFRILAKLKDLLA